MTSQSPVADKPHPDFVPNTKSESWRHRISRRLWGYDYFISYHWKSGGPYAVALAQRLLDQGYECFLDRTDYAMGDDWKQEGEFALRHTQRLVIVATREAITESIPVRREVEIFSARSNQVILIVFDGGFAEADRRQHPTLALLPDSNLYIEDTAQNLAVGPTEQVVSQLIKTHRILKRRSLRSRIVLTAVCILATALVAVTAFWINAEAARIAEANAKKDALNKSANAYWQIAVTARDRDDDATKAVHNLLRGAQALYTAGERPRSKNLQLAADLLARGMRSLPGQSEPIFNHDGSLCLVVGNDEIALWDMTAITFLRAFSHRGARYAKFSHDGKKFVSWRGFDMDRHSERHEATLWDISSASPLQNYDNGDDVIGAEFSPDDQQLLIWSMGDTAFLWNATSSEAVQEFRHTEPGQFHFIGFACFSKDGKRILTCCGNGTAKLWEVSKSDPLQTFSHVWTINGAVFNHDESRVLTWGYDGKAKLWEVGTKEPLCIFDHGTGELRGASFDRDETKVLTWSENAAAKLWKIGQTEPLQSFAIDARVAHAELNRDESRLFTWVSNTSAGEVTMWDVANGSSIRTFSHQGSFFGATLHEDQSHLMTWTMRDNLFSKKGGETTLWDVMRDEPLETFRDGERLQGAKFGRDASTIITWGDLVRIRDRVKAGPGHVFRHEGWVRTAEFTQSSRVLTTGNDGIAKLWSLDQTTPLQSFHHESYIIGTRFSRDERRLLTWSTDKSAKLWDVTSSTALNTFAHTNRVMGAVFTQDESRVLTWSEDNTAKLWDLKSDKLLKVFEHESFVLGARFDKTETCILTWGADGDVKWWQPKGDEAPRIFKHNGWIYEANLILDESQLLVRVGDGPYGSSSPNVVTLWDVKALKPLKTFGHSAGIRGSQLNGAQSRLLTYCDDATALLWDLNDDARPLQTLKHGVTVGRGAFNIPTGSVPAKVLGAIFNDDESQILTRSEDKTARLWAVGIEEPVQTFAHDDTVSGAKFLSHGSRVLTWSQDGTVKLWIADQPEPLQIFRHREAVTSAHLNRDETLLLTCENGIKFHTAQLWDVTRGEPLETFSHDDTVDGASFNQDESSILTWSNDGTAKLWDLMSAINRKTPTEQILEFEVGSATWLDDLGQVRPLKFEEWQTRKARLQE